MNRTFRLLAVLALSLFACTSHATDLPTCAVMTFEPGGGVSKDEVKALADGLESELIDLKRYKLVSRSNLTKVLEVQKISMECSGTECAIEAGKLAAIQYVVFGSIGKVGDTYSLVANLVDVETGVIEKTAKVTQSGKIDQLLIAGVAQAAKKLMGLSVEESAPPSSLVSLPSLSERKSGEPMTVDLGGGEKLELVWIEPGSFMMGSPAGEGGRDNDEVRHQVTLSKGFWMGKYGVTQRQWERVMGNNPSKFTGARNPVEQVSWEDCQAFVQKLNEVYGSTVQGSRFRLPTEAEWEYACRAGTTGAYAGDLDAMGWYGQNSGNSSHPAGQKKPNAWGLYDMHGNVCAWCQDWYGDYPTGSVMDPTGPGFGWGRVNRGGCWNNGPESCRSAERGCYEPGGRDDRLGLRLVRSPLEP
jgi:formylglycine-generating enzyme required for sulfatase activity